MSKTAPGAETLRDAILKALAAGPKSKAELASELALHGTSLGGHLAVLESRGRIRIRAGRVGLPGQLDEGEAKTAEEEQLEHFRQLWQQRGIAAICPADVQDSFLRQQICLLPMELYGRRGLSR